MGVSLSGSRFRQHETRGLWLRQCFENAIGLAQLLGTRFLDPRFNFPAQGFFIAVFSVERATDRFYVPPLEPREYILIFSNRTALLFTRYVTPEVAA